MKWIVHLDGGPRRVNHAAIPLNNGTKIYSFGGYSSCDKYDEPRPLDIHVLDTYTYRWTSLSVPSSKFDEQYFNTPYQRYGHTVVEYRGSAYLWGGRNDTDGGCDLLFCYNPQDGRWSRIKTKGCCPPKRDGHSACVYKDSMILFGGYEEEFQRFSNETYELDFRNMQWSQLQTSGIHPSWRDFHTATVIDNKMYIFGGRSDFMGQYLSNREIYDNTLRYLDLSDNSWHVTLISITDLNDSLLQTPQGRRSQSAWCYNGNLYIFGGYNGHTKEHFNDLHQYCVESGKWHKLLPNGLSPRPRRRQCCIPVGDRMFLFGGTSPKNGSVYSEEDENSFENYLIDHSDMYVLDMQPKLKTLCLSTLVENNLHYCTEILDTLPVDLRMDLATMTTPNKINTNRLNSCG